MDKDEKFEYIDLYGLANVKQYKTEVAFKTLIDGIKDNLYVVPGFQRVFRWSEEQVENLAVSLFRGMPIPPIYTYRNDRGQLEILDGQQRILSMFFYYIGKYTKKVRSNHIKLQKFYENDNEIDFLEALENSYGLKNKTYHMTYIDVNDDNETKSIDITYSHLPKDLKRKLDYTTLTIVEIIVDDKALRNRYLFKIFANLNSGGEKLSPQELRNGIYQSNFYDMLNRFNLENEKWRLIYRNKYEDKYCKDVELLLRFCALSSITKFENGKFQVAEYKRLNQLLDEFSDRSTHFDSRMIDDYNNKLNKFVDTVDQNIPKKTTLLDTLFVIIINSNFQGHITKKFCDELIGSDTYKAYVNDSTAKKSAFEKRLMIVYEEIQKNG